MLAFIKFECFTKTCSKTFVSGYKRLPLRKNTQHPCIFQTCRRSLRNLFIVARQFQVPLSKPVYFTSPTDKNRRKRANLLVRVLCSVSSVLVRSFVSVIVSFLALPLGDPVEALPSQGKTFEPESVTATWLKSSESVSRRSSETQIVLVKSARVKEQSQVKQKKNGNSKEVSTSPKIQLAKSEKFITWGLTLLVFAGVCFVLYKISLREEEEEAKAIEREYERLEQLKREFIEEDDDSPVRDEDLLSSLRKRLENQTQEDNQGSSEQDSEEKDPKANVENTDEESHPEASVEGEEIVTSEKTASTEGVSVEHLDMLRRMYEGTSIKNTEDGTRNSDVNKEDNRNAPNDTKYDEKGSKGRKSRA
ncbi:hypothetical protein GpartN1_g3447.t1 [Galdieria partita]|uniref:Uncharacterized protein n=1 Tax=Galdieria partita TaxID=83374 RepID=A0A9C7PXH0_9RHOD|nr:hypothetical protein GpartN1_g3447.t1 [Galdieria partita]